MEQKNEIKGILTKLKELLVGEEKAEKKVELSDVIKSQGEALNSLEEKFKELEDKLSEAEAARDEAVQQSEAKLSEIKELVEKLAALPASEETEGKTNEKVEMSAQRDWERQYEAWLSAKDELKNNN